METKFEGSCIDKINRRQLLTYLSHMIPFEQGTSRGQVLEKIYFVYSYDNVIGKVDMETGEVLYFDNNFYSSTTLCLQDIFRRAFSKEFELDKCQSLVGVNGELKRIGIDKIKRQHLHTYLSNMIPFNAGSARGRVMRRSNLYEVWSYNTLIGRVDIATRDVLYFDDTDYSATTSFIQRKFREVFIEIQAFAPEE